MIEIQLCHKAALKKSNVNCHYPELVSGVVLLAEMMAHLL